LIRAPRAALAEQELWQCEAADGCGARRASGTEPRSLYSSSPASEKAARQGLGGPVGLAVLLAAMAAVTLITLGVYKQGTPSSLAEARPLPAPCRRES